MSDDTTELTADVTAVSDGARTLFIADFNDTSAAHEAYQALKSLEDGRHFAIDGVVVVNRDADGKLEIEKDLSDAVAPGHSGIIALVSDPGAVEIREALAKANGIVESAVSDVVAKDIHAIADEVEKG